MTRAIVPKFTVIQYPAKAHVGKLFHRVRMNAVEHDVLQHLTSESLLVHGNPVRILHRDSNYIIFNNTSVLIAWYVLEDNQVWSDTSPKHAAVPNASELMNVRISTRIQAHFGTFPMAIPWRETRMRCRSTTFGSILLFPSGLRCGSSIRAVNILGRDRLAIAIITVDNILSVFVDNGPDEKMLFGTRTFTVSLYTSIPNLVSPSVICLIPPPKESSGESLFVMDAGSSMVWEYHFESSILSIPRSCPESKLTVWHLESGLHVPTAARVSVHCEPNGSRSLQIVGLSSNSDSHGKVKLLPNPVTWFTKSLGRPEETLETCGDFLIVNSQSHFRILKDVDFDFPVFISSRVDTVRSANLQGHAFVVVNSGNQIRLFSIENDRLSEIILVSPLGGVSSIFAIDSDPINLCMYLGCERGGRVEVWKLEFTSQGTVSSQSLVDSIPLEEPIVSMSVRAPVSPQDSLMVACILNSGKFLTRNLELEVTEKNDAFSICFSEEYFFYSTRGGKLKIVSLIPSLRPSSWELSLPRPCDPLRAFHWKGSFVVIAGPIFVVRKFDPYFGISWEVIDTHLLPEQLCELHEHFLMIADRTTGQISQLRVPENLWNLRASGQAEVLHLHCMASECRDFSLPNSPEWYKLSSELRDQVEALVAAPSDDLSRSSDAIARRFLIAEKFTITTEDLAWASFSDFQSFTITSLFPSSQSGLLWESVRNRGVGFWLKETSILKELVERIQKSVLQEYMRSKEPKILDDNLSFWLAAQGKQQLLSSLYKQHGSSCASPGHTKIAQFFSTDFSEPENRSKGMKNAFELVRQKRNGLAVAVFILVGAYQEAADICCRQMDDMQLGLVLLELVRLRGVEVSALIESTWESRVVRNSIENGDIWLPILYYWRRMNITAAMELFQTFKSPAVVAERVDAFRIQKFEISYPSVIDLLKLFTDVMRRFNRPVPEQLPSVSEEERLGCLYQTGCSPLALTSPRFHYIHPILKWAIHDRLMLSRSDSSTS